MVAWLLLRNTHYKRVKHQNVRDFRIFRYLRLFSGKSCLLTGAKFRRFSGLITDRILDFPTETTRVQGLPGFGPHPGYDISVFIRLRARMYPLSKESEVLDGVQNIFSVTIDLHLAPDAGNLAR
jgi:hypothetical protein